MKRIKLFENFKDDFPFSKEEIDEIFKSYFEDIPRLEFKVSTGDTQRVNKPVLIGDDLKFNIESVIVVEVEPQIENITYLKLNSIKNEYKDLFNAIRKTIEQRGMKVSISKGSRKFIFYIYI